MEDDGINGYIYMILSTLKHNRLLFDDFEQAVQFFSDFDPKKFGLLICSKNGKFSLQAIKCDKCKRCFCYPFKMMYHCIDNDHGDHDYCDDCYPYDIECRKTHRATVCDIYREYYMDHHNKMGVDGYYSKFKDGEEMDKSLRESFEKYYVEFPIEKPLNKDRVSVLMAAKRKNILMETLISIFNSEKEISVEMPEKETSVEISIMRWMNG